MLATPDYSIAARRRRRRRHRRARRPSTPRWRSRRSGGRRARLRREAARHHARRRRVASPTPRTQPAATAFLSATSSSTIPPCGHCSRLPVDGAVGDVTHVRSRRLNLGKIRTHETSGGALRPHDVALCLAILGPGVSRRERLVAAPARRVRGQTLPTPTSPSPVGDRRTSRCRGWTRTARRGSMPSARRRRAAFEGLARRRHPGAPRLRTQSAPAPVAGAARSDRVRSGRAAAARTRAFLDSDLNRNARADQRAAPPSTSSQSSNRLGRGAPAGPSRNRRSHEPPPVAPHRVAHETAVVDEPSRSGRHPHLALQPRDGARDDRPRLQYRPERHDRRLQRPIGDNVKIQNNVSIYGGVVLEDDVFCGPSMVFTNVSTPRSGTPRNGSGHYLRTLVKRGATIGANATSSAARRSASTASWAPAPSSPATSPPTGWSTATPPACTVMPASAACASRSRRTRRSARACGRRYRKHGPIVEQEGAR